MRRTYGISGSSIASAATTDVASSESEAVTVTGTTTITSLGTGFAGCKREVTFSGALQLTHSANLILPGAANLTTAANDVITFRCIAAGQWIVVAVSRASISLANAVLTGLCTYNGVEIGFRGIPRSTQNGNYFFVASDKGYTIAKTNTTAYTYTISNSVHSAGDVIVVQNLGSSGNLTIAQGAGFNLQLAGGTTAGDRTVVPGGLASIYFDSASHAMISGAGVT